MKILEISTLWERTPPPLYGGTEQIASFVSDGLTKKGHEVVLFATGDSKTKGKLKSVYPKPLYRSGFPWSEAFYPLLNIQEAIAYAVKNKFDIIHSHSGYFALFFAKFIKIPMVFTMHGNLRKDRVPDNQRQVLRHNRNLNFVSISKDQRNGMPELNWISTVYNGIDVYSYQYQPKPKDYLAWVGRISELKGTHLAIEIARKAKKTLIMAGKMDKKVDGNYFMKKVKPFIDGKKVVYLGEVSQAKKRSIMRNAAAFINPITWDEPFGLVVPESFSGGTPVVASNRGPMKELIRHGTTGFLFNNVKQAVQRINEIEKINRKVVRVEAEKRFHYMRMVDDYEKIFRKLK